MHSTEEAVAWIARSHDLAVRRDDAWHLANEVNRIEGVGRSDHLELIAACVEAGVVSDAQAAAFLLASVPASEEEVIWDPFGDARRQGLLRNRFRIGNKSQLEAAEFVFIHVGMREAMALVEHSPEVTARTWLEVHGVLLGRLYPWAGQVRAHQVERRYRFNAPERVLDDAEEVFRKASDPDYLLDRPGEIYGELAFCHPFYDGNGRSLNVVFDGMLKRVGHVLDWSRLEREPYMAHLTNAAFGCSYDGLTTYLRSLLS